MPDGTLRLNAEDAWRSWVEARIDSAGRALWRENSWSVPTWAQLNVGLRGAAIAIGKQMLGRVCTFC